MRALTASRLEERLYRERLAAGLSLYVWPKPGFRRQHALLAVDYGSLDRCFDLPGRPGPIETPEGVAHFLEHRLFARADGDLGERLAAQGAEVNAYTTYTTTVFVISCVEGLDRSLELLFDYLLRPTFTAAGVARERRIITREIQLYSDHLEWVSFFGAVGSLYPGHPLAGDMAGTPESVRRIDREALELCHRTFYHPGNMGLFVSGDLDPLWVRDRVARILGRRVTGSAAAFRRRRTAAPRRAPVERRELRLPAAQPRLWLAFRDRQPGLRGRALLRRELALELTLDLLFGPSSRFYQRHYEEGLIDDDTFGFEVYAETGFGFCLLGGDSARPADLERALTETLRRARRGARVERDLELFRRKAYGHLVYRLEQVDSCAALMHSAVSRGAQPFDFVAAHAELAAADLQAALASCLDGDAYGLCCVVPATPRRAAARRPAAV